MVDKITYEEALVEKLTKAFKEVVEQMNENDLWSKATTHNSPMHDSPKGDGDIQKVTRPKAENVSEKNPVGGVISKMPIENPRKPWDSRRNEDMNKFQARKLFEEKVDPDLERKGNNDAFNSHRIECGKELGMSEETALKHALDLYMVQEDKTANRKEGEFAEIKISIGDLIFYFE
jgi:CRISPR/Cas system-associated endonuclease/helicase Cas3